MYRYPSCQRIPSGLFIGVSEDRDGRPGRAAGLDPDSEQFAGAVVGRVQRPASVERDAVDLQERAAGELRIGRPHLEGSLAAAGEPEDPADEGVGHVHVAACERDVRAQSAVGHGVACLQRPGP